MYFYSLNWLWCINATISCVYIWKHGGSGFYCSHHRLNFRICKFRSCTISVGPAENYRVQHIEFFPPKVWYSLQIFGYDSLWYNCSIVIVIYMHLFFFSFSLYFLVLFFVCFSNLCILSYMHVPYGAFFINKKFEFNTQFFSC